MPTLTSQRTRRKGGATERFWTAEVAEKSRGPAEKYSELLHSDNLGMVSVSGFEADVADSSDDVVGGGLIWVDGDDLDGGGLVVGAENESVAGGFDVADGASFVFQNSVHIEFAFAIRRE